MDYSSYFKSDLRRTDSVTWQVLEVLPHLKIWNNKICEELHIKYLFSLVPKLLLILTRSQHELDSADEHHLILIYGVMVRHYVTISTYLRLLCCNVSTIWAPKISNRKVDSRHPSLLLGSVVIIIVDYHQHLLIPEILQILPVKLEIFWSLVILPQLVRFDQLYSKQ